MHKGCVSRRRCTLASRVYYDTGTSLGAGAPALGEGGVMLMVGDLLL